MLDTAIPIKRFKKHTWAPTITHLAVGSTAGCQRCGMRAKKVKIAAQATAFFDNLAAKNLRLPAWEIMYGQNRQIVWTLPPCEVV